MSRATKAARSASVRSSRPAPRRRSRRSARDTPRPSQPVEQAVDGVAAHDKTPLDGGHVDPRRLAKVAHLRRAGVTAPSSTISRGTRGAGLVQLVGGQILQRPVLAGLHPVDELAVEDGVGLAHPRKRQLGEVREAPGGDDAHVPRAASHDARDVLAKREAPRRAVGCGATNAFDEDRHQRRDGPRAVQRVDRTQATVWSRPALPRTAPGRSRPPRPFQDRIGQLLVQGVLGRHVVQHLVERLGVILGHPRHAAADTHTHSRHAVEREGVEMIVGDDDQGVRPPRRQPLAHAGDLGHDGHHRLAPQGPARALVVVGIEHV